MFVRNRTSQRVEMFHQPYVSHWSQQLGKVWERRRATDFPVRIPPEALVYCSKSSDDDPKGRVSSE